MSETVTDKQVRLRKVRSVAWKTRVAFLKTHTEKDLKEGAGKGLEPFPWCECHNRNPCPLDKELGI
jgi:hypothetical protein